MPAESKSQQRLFGLIHAVQKGEAKAPSKKISDMAKDIKPSSVTHYAETPTKGKPEHVEKTALEHAIEWRLNAHQTP